jgi:homoserine dehydrogenase
VAVSDMIKGSVYEPAGLNPADLLSAIQTAGKLTGVTAAYHDWGPLQVISDSNADVIVEVSYTDLTTGEPAFSYIKTALERGKHAVTTNKGPIALHYPELAALARAAGAEIGVEGTVMSGTPTLRLGQESLIGAGIYRIQGILNGTTNYILTQMEAGASYAAALAEAQAHGYAEADPSGDVEGYDAAGKVVILANLLLEAGLAMPDVARQGITHLTPADISAAQAAGERWKLISRVEKLDGRVQASVGPMRLPLAHPLASVGGVTNAITYSTALLGDVTVIGPGAGRLQTGYALLSDLLAIHRKVGG